jgi:DNA-binding NarL/FixJ family response regulator
MSGATDESRNPTNQGGKVMGIIEDRKKKAADKKRKKEEAIFHAKDLQARGWSNFAIAKHMSISESTVRKMVE